LHLVGFSSKTSQKITFGTEEDCSAVHVLLKAVSLPHWARLERRLATLIIRVFLISLPSEGSSFSASLLFYFLLHIFRLYKYMEAFYESSKSS